MDAHQMSHKRKKTCLLTCSLHATATASQLLNYISFIGYHLFFTIIRLFVHMWTYSSISKISSKIRTDNKTSRERLLLLICNGRVCH